MNRDYLDYVQDIIEAITDIERFIEGISLDSFLSDKKTTYAVVRSLEIIGEAAKKVPENIKKKYPQIPWKKMSGMRDKLIHEYFGIDQDMVWKVINEELPRIKPLFQKMIIELDED